MDSQRVENVLSEVGAERLAGYPLDEDAHPVDVHSVRAVRAWFELERLLEAG